MKKVRYTSSSANIAFYQEVRTVAEEREFPQHLVEVLRWDLQSGPVVNCKKTMTRRRIPTFSFTVRRWAGAKTGNKVVLQFVYEPKTKPKGYILPDRTVNRLLKEKMS